VPYIVHPKAVVEFIRPWAVLNFSPPFAELIMSIAILHDVVEDTDITLEAIIDELGPFFIETETLSANDAGAMLAKYLKLLTRTKGTPYMEYLSLIKHYKISKQIKLADLQHNMSDLPVSSLRDKYELSVYYLNN
jgi:(p)ppGpp synthase/HD superfamily hydrolase